MQRRIAIFLLIFAIYPLTLATNSKGQPNYAPNMFGVVQEVNDSCPGLILNDHSFTDAVATKLWLKDPAWGRNGKRGNPNDPSHDAIAYKTPTSPFGVAVIDIIASAGSPAAKPAWIDVTDATIKANTIGVWVRPSAILPDCLSEVSPPPPPPPPPGQDLTDVIVTLSRIENRLLTIEAQQLEDHERILRYINDMTGDGPDGPKPLPNHITDIKQRLDVIRIELEQLDSWLKGRSVLRW